MSMFFKSASKTLISMVGMTSASLLLSLPALASIHQAVNTLNNPTALNGELLAQGSSGDAGDEGLSEQELPSIDITNDESSTTDSNNNQSSPTRENTRRTNPSLQNNNTQTDNQYSNDPERLTPGTWLCVNNPNPQCDS